jgi:predicted alpha/beta-fold hydrolase
MTLRRVWMAPKAAGREYDVSLPLWSGDICVPFLVLQSADDPVFCDAVREIVPLQEFKQNPNVIYVETPHGGHFGWVEGRLRDAYETDTMYTYPARVAELLFQSVAEGAGKPHPASQATIS